MSKTRIFAFIVIAIMFAAIFTNPSKEQFEEVIATKAKGMLEKQMNYKDQAAVQLGMTLFGDRVVKEFVNNNIIIKNYYLFSVAEIKWEGQEHPIGGGAFKQIWLSPKIDEKAEEIIMILKNI